MSKYDVVIVDDPKSVENEWEALVAQSAQGCIFNHLWWLDAVCPMGYKLILVKSGEKILAGQVVPYRGIKEVYTPSLTQVLGPILMPSSKVRYADKLSDEMELLDELAQAIGIYKKISFRAHYSLTNWLPYRWRGFSQTTRYTYVIPDISDLELVYGGFTKKFNCKIQKAQKICHIEEYENVADFYEMNCKTFARQNLRVPYPLSLLERIDATAKAHNARICLVAKDDQDRPHVSIYVVYDIKSAYVLMSGGDPELRSSEAKTMLVAELLKRLSGKTISFDFAGSVIKRIESWARATGARQIPYLSITKDSRSRLERTADMIVVKFHGLKKRLYAN